MNELIPVRYSASQEECGEVRPGVFTHVFATMEVGEACQCGRWIAGASLIVARGAVCDLPPISAS